MQLAFVGNSFTQSYWHLLRGAEEVLRGNTVLDVSRESGEDFWEWSTTSEELEAICGDKLIMTFGPDKSLIDDWPTYMEPGMLLELADLVEQSK